MLNERLSAAHAVAAKLFETEKAIDLAIAHAAELSAAMPTARLKANLSATVGQEALVAASNAIAALIVAREHAITAHARLNETRDQIGLATVAIGGGMVKPEDPLIVALSAPVRAA
jgi:hypothetical protein